MHGAGIYTIGAGPTIANCRIVDGIAVKDGGGIYCENGASPVLRNCVVANNSAPRGGAIYSSGSEPMLVNCTLTRNEADAGGAIYSTTLSPTVLNSILWDNGAGQIEAPSGAPIITYSDVEDGYTGDGNIDTDPLLTGTYRLRANSPCVDAGDGQTTTRTDIDGELRSDPPDMGADEFVDEGGNWMADVWEARYGLDPNINDGSRDSDKDGVSNLLEYELGTDPESGPDGDADGLPDSWELQYFGDLRQRGFDDYDHDGISNIDEFDGESDPSAGPEIGEQIIEEKDLTSWYLFPSVPEQALDENGGIIMTREIETHVLGRYDRFYISSSPDGAGGWDLAGVRIDIQIPQTMYKVCNFGDRVAEDESLDITDHYPIPTGTTKLKVHIRYDGSGTIGIDAPLYLLKWSPKVKVEFPGQPGGPEDPEDPERTPLYIPFGQTRQITFSHITTPPKSGQYQATLFFESSARGPGPEPDLSFYSGSITLSGTEQSQSVAVTALNPSETKDDTTITLWSINQAPNSVVALTIPNVRITETPVAMWSGCSDPPRLLGWNGKIKVDLIPADPAVTGQLTIKVGSVAIGGIEVGGVTIDGADKTVVAGGVHDFDPPQSGGTAVAPGRVIAYWVVPNGLLPREPDDKKELARDVVLTHDVEKTVLMAWRDPEVGGQRHFVAYPNPLTKLIAAWDVSIKFNCKPGSPIEIKVKGIRVPSGVPWFTMAVWPGLSFGGGSGINIAADDVYQNTGETYPGLDGLPKSYCLVLDALNPPSILPDFVPASDPFPNPTATYPGRNIPANGRWAIVSWTITDNAGSAELVLNAAQQPKAASIAARTCTP